MIEFSQQALRQIEEILAKAQRDIREDSAVLMPAMTFRTVPVAYSGGHIEILVHSVKRG